MAQGSQDAQNRQDLLIWIKNRRAKSAFFNRFKALEFYPCLVMPNFRSLLDAIDGIAYTTDADARITAIGLPHWNRFATANEAPDLDAHPYVGRPIFDFIEGESVRGVYRERIKEVLGTGQAAIFATRCDGPKVKRELRVSITRLDDEDQSHGLLFQFEIIDEVSRPALDIYDFKAVSVWLKGQADVPIITMCSFCQRLALDSGNDAHEWISAEHYYHRGGVSKVRVSHGLCADCYTEHHEERLGPRV